ncbi:MAG: hypothetical protein SFU56_08780 [Capsulimonadales bacterium]|nr:hypothetical protein [Capsulimonadales bacterium]
MTNADSLADALVAGQLSERTRSAYASDLAERLTIPSAWGLTLPAVTRNHLHAFRSSLLGVLVAAPETKTRPCAIATVNRKMAMFRRFFLEALDRGARSEVKIAAFDFAKGSGPFCILPFIFVERRAAETPNTLSRVINIYREVAVTR